MSDADTIRELKEALREAAAAARVAMGAYDEQAGRFFDGLRPDWRKAATTAFNEFDGKVSDWEELAR